MRLGVILAGLLGLGLAVGLVAWFGAGSILASIERIGWVGFGLYVAWQMATFLPLGAAWHTLAIGQPARRLANFTWGRQVREGAADVLPFSPIGGLVIGARAVALSGVPAEVTYGSVAVDLVTEIVGQFAFILLGLALLLGHLSKAALERDPLLLVVFVGLGLMALGAATFIVAQRRGLGGLDRLMARWLPSAAGHVQGANREIAEIYRHPLRLALSTVLHTGAWFAAAVGSWIALRYMGAPQPITALITIESLVSAAKSAAFMVPNAAGVQEGGFVVVGALFGLSPETAIALSLLRRARDIVIGAPTLIVWQALEGRRMLTARSGVQP